MSQFPPSELRELVPDVANLLRSRSETVSVVRNAKAAGGIVSAALLSVPGASRFYKGGLTLYTLESRVAFAGWTDDHVRDYRGPTGAVVAELAANVRDRLGSTWTVAESGTAGPTGGGARNRTPGYVALAVAGAEGVHVKEVETGYGDRERNMVAFAKESLLLLMDAMRGAKPNL